MGILMRDTHFMESCPSGRRCSTRNAVRVKPPRVRIPNSPPQKDADLDTKVSVFSLPEKPCTAGLFSICWVHGKSFPPIFGCKRRLMLISPCFTLPVGCMIKRLRFFELAAVLYWVHPFFPITYTFYRPTHSCPAFEPHNGKQLRIPQAFFYSCSKAEPLRT